MSALLNTLAKGWERSGGESPNRGDEDILGTGLDALLSPVAPKKRSATHPGGDGVRDRSSERRRQRVMNKSKMLDLLRQVCEFLAAAVLNSNILTLLD